MHRRNLLVALAAWPASAAFAHHGWSSFDQGRPLYLDGFARKVAWRNPHAEFELEVDAEPKLPADLATRTMPAMSRALASETKTENHASLRPSVFSITAKVPVPHPTSRMRSPGAGAVWRSRAERQRRSRVTGDFRRAVGAGGWRDCQPPRQCHAYCRKDPAAHCHPQLETNELVPG